MLGKKILIKKIGILSDVLYNYRYVCHFEFLNVNYPTKVEVIVDIIILKLL